MAEEDRGTMPKDGNMKSMQMLQPKPGGSQIVAFTASSVATTNVVNSNALWIECDQDCWIRFGAAPVAVADDSDFHMKANRGQYFKAEAGVDKVAAIRFDTSGNMRVTEMQ